MAFINNTLYQTNAALIRILPSVKDGWSLSLMKMGLRMKMSEARKEIENNLKKMSKLVPKGDSVGLASHYSMDTVVMSPNTEVIHGRAAVKAFWDYGFKEFGYKEMSFKTEEVVGLGDYAMEHGTYTFKAQPKGMGIMEDRGKYITIWKRAPEGWLIHWDIFNSSLPPQK